ncbi:MAG: hypothetical protein JWP29_261 [Rhodoferax sp.]|nr:hypothetical protein [Rhodoferax sp.]
MKLLSDDARKAAAGPDLRRNAHALERRHRAAFVPLCTWGTENAAEMAGIFAKRDASPLQQAGGR